VICEACNTNNTDDAAYCAECGRPFDAIAPARLVKHSFSQRILGAIMLRSAMYEEIESDTTATSQAFLVVVWVSLLTSLIVVAGGEKINLTGIALGVVGEVLSWVAWAAITLLLGSTILRGANTHVNWGQLARTLGFAQAPGILRVAIFIPGIGGVLFLASLVLQLMAMVVAVRQALDYTSTLRAVFVVVLSFVPYVLVRGALESVLGTFV
jgi:hypothetical protein